MFPPDTSLDDLTLAFLDVETTGLSARHGDRVCEIAVVRSRLDLVQATFQSLVNPGRPISPGAAAVNGLSDDDVRNAPSMADIAGTVLMLLDGAVVVCHNAPFDLGFLSAELRRAGRPWPRSVPTVVDTLALARSCFRFRSNGLGAVARALGIDTGQAHRALADAQTTRAVYLNFVQDLWGRRGIRTLGALLEAQASPPVFDRPRPEMPLPAEIDEAFTSGRRLFLKYVDAQGEVSERWVTPQEVTGFGDTLSLVAFCHLRGDVRQFRLDRVIAMTLADSQGQE